MKVEVHRITTDDLDAVDTLLMAAFGRTASMREELERCLALQPDGRFVAMRDEMPVGTGGAVDYGTFASIGLVAVDPAWQRGGIGAAIMGRMLEWLEERGCPMAVLDATEAAAPLYRRLGFVEEGRTVVWVRETGMAPVERAPAVGVAALKPGEREEVAVFDRPRFGAARAAVLAAYLDAFPGRAWTARDARGRMTGYLVAQAQRLGPWVAETPEAAEALLGRALAEFGAGPASALAPEANAEAASLLTRHGFARTRTRRWMRRGGAPRTDYGRWVYGKASLALG